MNEAKRKNILFAVVAVVIAVVFFFAGFGTGFGVGKGAADAPDADAGAADMDGGMLLSSDDDTDRGVSLTSVKIAREAYDDYDIMPIAQTAYTVTATVSGDGLTEDQKGVTWSEAAFKDPASEWATGKNVSDYVTTSPNGNKLTVQCLQAFGEQIIIKCSSSFNPNVSKDLKVDYMEKVESFDLVVDFSDDSGNTDFTFPSTSVTTAHFSWIPLEISRTNFSIDAKFSSASTIALGNFQAKVSFVMSNAFVDGLRTVQPGCLKYDMLCNGSDRETVVNFSKNKPKIASESNFLTYNYLYNFFYPTVYFRDEDTVLAAKQKFLELHQRAVPFLDVYVQLGEGARILLGHVVMNGPSFRAWLNTQSSVTGVDFDAPYSDGVIFNQD